MTIRASSALFVCLALGCGGKAEDGSGGAGGSGAASSGGTASGAPCGPIPPYYCVPAWCGGDVVHAPSCSANIWTCPEGTVPPSECPDDTCFHPPVYSCCDALGQKSQPTCPGQAGEVCPPTAYLWMNLGGPCPPAGMFPCGHELSCKLGQEYCRAVSSELMTCEPLPASCGSTPSCGCLGALGCGQCSDAGLDALTLHCQS